MHSPMRLAKTMCEISDWSVSNLRLQKMLYFAHMIYLGQTGRQLVNTPFEAWDYGPVHPEIYHNCKMFGSKPVAFIPGLVKSFSEEEEPYIVLKAIYEALKDRSGAELIALTHKENGAWAKVYEPNAKGVKIKTQDILEEYNA